jgi:hypothetical protein
MDAKITKERLARMLSYDWIKFIALGLVAVFVWLMIFTFTATKITTTQSFAVFNHKSNATLTSDFYTLLNDCVENEDGFSYEVIETQVFDLSTQPDHAATFYEAHLSAETAHLIFMPYAEGGEAQSFVNRYFLNLTSAHDFIENMKAYVSAYYTDGDYKNGEQNKTKIESDFRAMINANNDKRFKGKAFAQGLVSEYARIQKYADALVEFEGYLSQNLIRYEFMEVQDASHPETVYIPSEEYMINLCPDPTTMSNLKNYLYRYVGTTNTKTSTNMSVFFCKKDKESNTAYSYESLIFLNRLIRAAKTTNA